MTEAPALLARGPWTLDKVDARWSDTHFEPQADATAAADDAIAALRERGSPSQDGVAARLVGHEQRGDRLALDLQPSRWGLRLIPGDANDSIAALCVTRDAEGRWLAGRRAPWVSTWAGRWALGAGGAVDVGENPAHTLVRELKEEWSVEPERTTAEALVRLPHHLILFVGVAWLPDGAEVTPDEEHDAHAWWPADIGRWPDEADQALRVMGGLLA